MSLAERVARATEIVTPWSDKPGFVGAYLTGSAVRSFAHADGDLDIGVVLEPGAYAALAPSRRYKVGIDRGPPRRKEYDLQVRSMADLEAFATCDVDHYRSAFRYIQILRDSAGRIADIARSIATLPEDIREERLRVHCVEFTWAQQRARKCTKRGDSTNERSLIAHSLTALGQCLFLAQGVWPDKLQWQTQALLENGVPAPLVECLELAWQHLDAAHSDALEQAFFAWLSAKGYSFHLNVLDLQTWLAVDPAGLAAHRRWVRVH
ncbi:MAG TPA: DUF4037 domain-containing protein [Kofleriaceae bacterium]|jgi:hypothetical protein